MPVYADASYYRLHRQGWVPAVLVLDDEGEAVGRREGRPVCGDRDAAVEAAGR